jgi:hypothetical protein
MAVSKELGNEVSAVMVQKSPLRDPISTQQRIWKFLGNRLVEAHIRGNVLATETELFEIGISFAVLPQRLKFRSSRDPQLEFKSSSSGEFEKQESRREVS